jgi:uncharacterized membrane protein/uncharacterized membrane protein YbhN (UPF0104 family)
MKSHFFTIIKYIIGWPLTLLAIFFIIKIIIPNLSTILYHIQHLNNILFLSGFFCFLIFYFLRSYIWHRLLKNYSYNILFKESCKLWALSELRRFIPGSIWGFLGRTVSFSQKGVKKQDIGTLIVIEAELFIFGCLIIALLALSFLTKYSLVAIPSYINICIIYIVALLSIIFIYNKIFIHKIFPNKLTSFLSIILPKFPSSEIFLLIVISSISALFFGLGYFFIISSFVILHPQLLFALTGYFVLAFLIGYLSLLTPAGFGVREGLLIAALSKIIPSAQAAFASLFSRIILILSELFFVLIVIVWNKIRNINLLKLERYIATHKYESVLFFLCLIYTFYFSATSFLRYDNFYTGRFDLGNMVQTVWNTAHGRIFQFTNPNGTEVISRLAFHADFLLILLTPLYMIWQDPRMLLFLQTLILASGAFFVFLIAKNVLKNKIIALTFAFIYLINPSIQRTNLYDFHAVTLATTFLLGTYYFYYKKKYLLFILFAILSAFAKEHIWLIIALFGIFLCFQQRKWILGSIIFLTSAGTFYFLIWHAIPDALKSQHFALTYYAEFGDTPSKIVKTIVFSPTKIIKIIGQTDRILYLKELFSPLGYLSLFFPVFLLFAVPDLIINLLSNNTQLHQIYYQYTSTITPFLFVSAIYSVLLLKKLLIQAHDYFPLIKSHNRMRVGQIIDAGFITYLLVVSLRAAYLFGPLPGANTSNLDMFVKQVPDREYISTYVSQIPIQYSIAASNNIGSHLSQREKIYVLPLGIDKADYVIFLLNDSEMPQSLTAEKILEKKLRKDSNYTLAVDRSAFVVFKKKEI